MTRIVPLWGDTDCSEVPRVEVGGAYCAWLVGFRLNLRASFFGVIGIIDKTLLLSNKQG